jgi:Concanavalin A-like lectin/glucanases superfamily
VKPSTGRRSCRSTTAATSGTCRSWRRGRWRNSNVPTSNVAGVQRARFFIRDAGIFFGATSSVALTTGSTYHLVGTYDGSTVRIYVNGVDQGSSAHTGAVDDTTVPLVISTSSVSIWNGRLDEVAIYGEALTSTQVQAHYTRGPSG